MIDKYGPGWPMMAPDAGSAGAEGETANADAGQAGDQQAAAAQGQAQAGSLQWDTWIGEQPEQVQVLIDGHTKGLKSALESERRQRSDLAKQLREAVKASEAGSEMRKTLESMTTKVEQAELRARFYEEGVKPDIGCTNPRLAMLAAQELDAIDSKGRILWETIKQHFPEMFRPPQRAPQGNAGAGTGAPPPAAASNNMNAYIRRAAGR
jgi:hypothetical protein